MTRRIILSALSGLFLVLSCNGKPTPNARRTTPPPDTRRRAARTPPPPAPTGPNLDKRVLAGLQVGAIDRLDDRIQALLPPLFRQFAQGLLTRRVLPGLARNAGLNVLALDALDTSRPAAFGLLLEPRPKPQRGLTPRIVAVFPVKGDGKLVVDAVKASYSECTTAAWGGLEIRQAGETVAWVTVREGWAVVAPTGPLLDSAFRYLVPRTKGVPEGTARIQLQVQALLRLLKPHLKPEWEAFKRMAGYAPGGIYKLLAKNLPLLEQIGDHLASIDTVELALRAGDTSWTFEARIKPRPKGLLAAWIAQQKTPGGFGLNILPKGALLAFSDWSHARLRTLWRDLLSGLLDLQTSSLTDRLPRQAAERGLLKQKRPVSFVAYRRVLRDLNLQSYRASYAFYRVVFHLHKFREHLTRTLAPLVKNSTGRSALALYATPGPGLGFAYVDEAKDAGKLARDFRTAMYGNMLHLNSLLAEAYKMAPTQAKKLLGNQVPLQVVWNPAAAKVGRVTVSALGLRIRWPKPQPGFTPQQTRDLSQIDSYRAIVERVLGKGDATVAWAYLGKRLLVSAGKGWKARLATMIRHATGKPTGSVLQDPLLRGAAKAGAGERLTQAHFAGSRLTLALLDAVAVWAPQLARSGMFTPIAMMLRQSAQNATSATSFTLARHKGDYVISLRIPQDDLKTVVLGTTWLLFYAGATHRSKGAPTVAHPPPMPVTP